MKAKKIMSLTLALVMAISLITPSLASGATDNSGNESIIPHENRWYYRTEYTDVFASGVVEIEKDFADVKDAIKNAISEGLGDIVSSQITNEDAKDLVDSLVTDLFNYVYAQEPYARWGTYYISMKYKLKYRVNRLDESERYVVDKILCTHAILKQDGVLIDEFDFYLPMK